MFWNSFPYLKDQWTRNFIGSIKVTSRSKIAKLHQLGNPRRPPFWESILNLGRKCQGDLYTKSSKNCFDWKSNLSTIATTLKTILNFFRRERPIDLKLGRMYQSKNCAMAAILKVYFELLLQNRKASSKMAFGKVVPGERSLALR